MSHAACFCSLPRWLTLILGKETMITCWKCFPTWIRTWKSYWKRWKKSQVGCLPKQDAFSFFPMASLLPKCTNLYQVLSLTRTSLAFFYCNTKFELQWLSLNYLVIFHVITFYHWTAMLRYCDSYMPRILSLHVHQMATSGHHYTSDHKLNSLSVNYWSRKVWNDRKISVLLKMEGTASWNKEATGCIYLFILGKEYYIVILLNMLPWSSRSNIIISYVLNSKYIF